MLHAADVGGGIRTVEDMYAMLRAGADKPASTRRRWRTPDLIRAGAEKFGSQCVVVSIDAQKSRAGPVGGFQPCGRKPTGLEAVDWAKRAVALGAGRDCFEQHCADGTQGRV